jgi:hypothetical protein
MSKIINDRPCQILGLGKPAVFADLLLRPASLSGLLHSGGQQQLRPVPNLAGCPNQRERIGMIAQNRSSKNLAKTAMNLLTSHSE